MKPSAVVRLLIAFAAAAAAAPALAADAKAAFQPDAARGEAASAVCQACHVVDGTRGAAANPILLGQHPEYIVKQLTEFKSGKRKSVIMGPMVTPLDENTMKDIAAFYASKAIAPGFAKDKKTVQQGEQIYRGGIANRQVPACAGCHSPNGAGIPSQYPRLGSQHAEYSETQLLAFRSGERANSAQMSAIAAQMNDSEMKAVADYMAGLH